jgi:hypothetical protein
MDSKVDPIEVLDIKEIVMNRNIRLKYKEFIK